MIFEEGRMPSPLLDHYTNAGKPSTGFVDAPVQLSTDPACDPPLLLPDRDVTLEFKEEDRPTRERSLLERQAKLNRINLELQNENRRLKRLCTELEEKSQRLKRAETFSRSLLLNMNHEIRSPLNSIFALTTLLLRGAASDQRNLLGYIRKAADTMLDLVSDSLDLARQEGDAMAVHVAPFEAADALDTLRGLLPETLVHPGVRLVFEEGAAIPTIYSDRGKILQILRNLINNALKYTARGEVRVGACYDQGVDLVHFSVRDTGIGIAPEMQRTIFNQGNASIATPDREAKRSGLGLPLCLRLAALLGGRLLLRSVSGGGSTFVLAVPRVLAVSCRLLENKEATAGRDGRVAFVRTENSFALAAGS